jgi:hypothetical protein
MPWTCSVRVVWKRSGEEFSWWPACSPTRAPRRCTSDSETIAFFAGAIKDQPVDGVLRALIDDEDRVADITLMLRPWAAVKAGITDIKI